MNRRQVFLSQQQYHDLRHSLAGTEQMLLAHPMPADTGKQGPQLDALEIQSATLNALILEYTAGADIASLAGRLDRLILDYERHQQALGDWLQAPDIAPLDIESVVHEFEEYVQVISLCILLQRSDLLPRFVALFDRAGYHGEDTLVEDLLKPFLAERLDLDEWYHELYTPLIKAIYAEDRAEAAELLEEYCNQWYPAFTQAPWFDSHQQVDDSEYVGYWAFEAAAIAYLYDLDDSRVRHLIYPRDLVQYARRFSPPPIPSPADHD
ncbi:PoNe immunity protein domain-containing protein [Pseudomonas sp. CF161]|uniref:PoNe immunity protein domain-containing protein n=1 Tax=Pseudomonas sp. CF161 TaxID=911241 RepID=UPI0003550C15|nr:PoNe immunity protein domain-containing protein [Pseudomonas sp. CF161]EPL03764.1 hypothetical protein CF161_30368 [Pseudomonas sp. CF161]